MTQKTKQTPQFTVVILCNVLWFVPKNVILGTRHPQTPTPGPVLYLNPAAAAGLATRLGSGRKWPAAKWLGIWWIWNVRTSDFEKKKENVCVHFGSKRHGLPRNPADPGFLAGPANLKKPPGECRTNPKILRCFHQTLLSPSQGAHEF